jgi:hypothetical protein
MENILLEEINRMRRLMNLMEVEDIETEDTLDNDPLRDTIITSLKQQIGGGKEIYVRLVDNRPGKEGKSNIVKMVNGEVIDIDDDQPEPVSESIKDTLKIGAVCLILASGMVSCTKEDGNYNLANDSRFTLKPGILNTLGKEYFDSPVQGKDKIYVIASNQSGAGKGRERYLYHDYTSKIKNYGSKPFSSQEYPDSFATGANGIAPTEVVQVFPFNADMVSKLQPYNKTGIPLGTFLGKYKNVVVVEVLGSSNYDWSDPYNPKEVNDTKRKVGHAIYLTNTDGINVGELYPTTLDVMFGTYKNPITGNDKLMGLDDYYNNNFNNLLGDKPEL